MKGEQGGGEGPTSLHAVERVQIQLGRVGRVGTGRVMMRCGTARAR